MPKSLKTISREIKKRRRHRFVRNNIINNDVQQIVINTIISLPIQTSNDYKINQFFNGFR
uniref:Uncharacterized protein n=1 Tax=Rhizophagus irregularis (strain DAOM 181602 / DAOM 197198 / MUCL 43194) TaxID=747089 RepID=U9TZC6_RHIID